VWRVDEVPPEKTTTNVGGFFPELNQVCDDDDRNNRPLHHGSRPFIVRAFSSIDGSWGTSGAS
jgi:hypothetical protein